ncbi:MAG: VOC family protein [Acidimicrobiales bacterium]
MANLINVTIHAREPRRLAAFWSGALGYPVAQDSDDLVRLAGPRTGGAPDVLILRADELAPTGGRVHVDLAASDIGEEVRRLLALGAQLVDGEDAAGPRRREAHGIPWVVLTDPEGNELCVGYRP